MDQTELHKKKGNILSVRITDKMKDGLTEIAQKLGMPISDVVFTCIFNMLSDVYVSHTDRIPITYESLTHQLRFTYGSHTNHIQLPENASFQPKSLNAHAHTHASTIPSIGYNVRTEDDCTPHGKPPCNPQSQTEAFGTSPPCPPEGGSMVAKSQTEANNPAACFGVASQKSEANNSSAVLCFSSNSNRTGTGTGKGGVSGADSLRLPETTSSDRIALEGAAEAKIPAKAKTRPPKAEYRAKHPEAFPLTRKLHDAILTWKPNAVIPANWATKWTADMDLILLKDERLPETVAGMIDWLGVHFGEPYQCSVFSASDLRNKFDRIEIQMERTPAKELTYEQRRKAAQQSVIDRLEADCKRTEEMLKGNVDPRSFAIPREPPAQKKPSCVIFDDPMIEVPGEDEYDSHDLDS